MINKLLTFSFLLTLFGLFVISTNAQNIDASTRNGRSNEEEIPQNIQESLKKQEIERLKKDYDEMLENGEKAVKLTEEVENSFNKSSKLNSDDLEKLEKIEKLLKKIRNELGGDSDEDDKPAKPISIKTAISSLKESANSLFNELKKTSRYSISVVAIQSSNKLIDIVRYIRFWKK